MSNEVLLLVISVTMFPNGHPINAPADVSRSHRLNPEVCVPLHGGTRLTIGSGTRTPCNDTRIPCSGTRTLPM